MRLTVEQPRPRGDNISTLTPSQANETRHLLKVTVICNEILTVEIYAIITCVVVLENGENRRDKQCILGVDDGTNESKVNPLRRVQMLMPPYEISSSIKSNK